MGGFPLTPGYLDRLRRRDAEVANQGLETKRAGRLPGQPRVADGAQRQNRTADTGIFNANKINELLILLEQAICGKVRQTQVNSIACVSLTQTAEFRWFTAGVPRIRQIPNKKLLSADPENPAFEERDA